MHNHRRHSISASSSTSSLNSATSSADGSNQPQPTPSTPNRRPLSMFPATKRVLGLRSNSPSEGSFGSSTSGGTQVSNGTEGVYGGLNRPQRMSTLHQVSTPYTPESSPISPSVMIPNSASSTSTLTTSFVGGQNRRNGRQSFAAGMASSPSAAGYYGPSSSVSSLGFESGYLQGDGRLHAGSSSSSDEDAEDEDITLNGAYESDDRMSVSSRRPSVTSSYIKSDSEDMFTTFRSKLRTSTRTESKKVADKSDGPKAAIRQLYINSKSLKPKMKSFLRVSRELQNEQSPMDCEMKHELEVTQAFREEDNEPAYSNHLPPVQPAIPSTYFDDIAVPLEASSTNTSVSNSIQTNTTAFNVAVPSIARRNSSSFRGLRNSVLSHPSDTDDSDINAPSSPARSVAGPAGPAAPALKRKAALMEESNLPNTLKRRAVSPGISSPVMGSPSSTALGAKRSNIKQIQDASETFQNMTL